MTIETIDVALLDTWAVWLKEEVISDYGGTGSYSEEFSADTADHKESRK